MVPAGRCLLETSRSGGHCALDIDDVNTCDRDGRCTGTGGNLSAHPRFVAPAAGDFRLLATSPLIDRGFDPVAGDGLTGLDRSAGLLGSVSLYAAGLPRWTSTASSGRRARSGTSASTSGNKSPQGR